MLPQKLLLQVLFAWTSVAWSPTNSYAPAYVTCPDVSLVRDASKLSDSETEWVAKRTEITKKNLGLFLEYSTSLDSSEYQSLLEDDTIKIGLSFSGGGYRAMLSGGGQLSGLDNRTTGAFEHGLGGLLESSTYIAGLSGGNWLVGTLALNNWTSVEEISTSDTIWNLNEPLYALGGENYIKDYEYWDEWIKDIKAKQKAGFEVSLIDVWARALSTVFSESAEIGAADTWSTIASSDVFTNAQMPFPISISDAFISLVELTSTDTTIIETNPFELGSWDPTLDAFTLVQYLGSNLTDGEPYDSQSCVEGFDNGGFIMASSSDVFNIPADDLGEELSGILANAIDGITTTSVDKAIYPNPFYQSAYGTQDDFANDKYLYLVDGSEGGENVPVAPVTLTKRSTDLVLAFDNSADTSDNWPNGASIVSTYERQFSAIGAPYSFPYVPPTSTFLAKNFTHRPVFFGCDATNLTELSSIPPLVVYIANSDYSFASNTKTLQLQYTDEQKLGMIQNGFEVVTRNNLTEDSNWATCVGCAAIRRAQERAGIEQSDVCQQCFTDYCWDGEV
ncbi:hypothetical protein DASC09_037110 [Saccharomycopsis crataegensis]|uniref:Lysophospholipase n=1 Tax=Saccharomycopsis crataegensis TaxID=43959 RepID=A0AAV5QNU3_9ASCO|nr:hypothetical protein DASC09_037110 [Saccharomycopsis crataegensis]